MSVIKDLAITAALKVAKASVADSLLSDFCEIEKLWCKEGIIYATVLPLGSKEKITAHVGKLVIAEDNSTIVPTGMGADMPWVDNVLKKFVEGIAIPVPENARTALGIFKKAL